MASSERPDGSDRKAVAVYSDQLHKEGQWNQLLEYLQQLLGTEGDDPELTWRLLRCAFRLGQRTLESGDSREAGRIADLAMEVGRRALAKEDRNFFLHKWSGILYRLIGDIKGTKVKIENSFKIKEHFLKASQIDPEDQSVRHLLGRWCFQVASVSWMERKMASVVFATPPTSSYDEALSYFESAEKAEPGFFKANWLWMGKTLVKMNKKEEGKQWLLKLTEIEPDDIDVVEAKQDATELLKQL